jgi:hemoglobin-like flavoprotein
VGSLKDWLWHLLNDPLHDNPWSIVALILVLALALFAMLVGAGVLREIGRMFRRRNKETDVDSNQVDLPTAGSQPAPHVPDETPQQQRERRDEAAHRRPSSGEEPEAPTVVREGYPYTSRPTSLADLPPNDYAETVTTGGDTKAYRARQEAGAARAAQAPPAVYDVAPEDSGVHAIPVAPAEREECPKCRGRGYVPTTNELLRESIALVADGGDMVVKEFYTRLLQAAPDLAALFPPDLLTAASGNELSDGYGQRNRLLGALVSLSQLYDPTNPDLMTRLGVFLMTWGGRHAAFQRPDGTVRGATLAEYEAVRKVLFTVLSDAAGDKWLPEYTAAWDEAYEHAAEGMIAGQFTLVSERAGQLHPRQPRT